MKIANSGNFSDEDIWELLMKSSKSWDNASYHTPNPKALKLDSFEPEGGALAFENSFDLAKNAQIGGYPFPGTVKIGLPYTDNVPVIAHEVSGHGLQRGRVLPIDREARKLIEPKDWDDMSDDAKDAWDYWKTGSKGKEPNAFLHELREAMFQRGLIKSRHQEITPHLIKIARVSFTNKPMGVLNLSKPFAYHTGYLSNTRILDFMADTPDNSMNLSRLLNKLPAMAPIAIGTGTVLANQKYGGEQLPKAQVGDEFSGGLPNVSPEYSFNPYADISESTQPFGYTVPVLPVEKKIDLIPKPPQITQAPDEVELADWSTILANPMQAWEYIGKNGFTRPTKAELWGGKDNIYDSVMSMFNPASYVEALKHMDSSLDAADQALLQGFEDGRLSPGDLSKVVGNLSDAGMEALFLSIAPMGGRTWAGAIKELRRPVLGSRIPQEFTGSRLLGSAAEAATTESSALQQLAGNTQKALPAGEIHVRYGKEALEGMLKPLDFDDFTVLQNGVKVPKNMTWFGPANRSGNYNVPGTNKFEATLDVRNPLVVNMPEVWTVERIQDVISQGYDAIVVTDATGAKVTETIPLDKSIINVINKSKPLQQLAGNKPKVKQKVKKYVSSNPYEDSNVANNITEGGNWSTTNSGVYQYPSFMTGSKLERQVSAKDGTIARSVLEQLVKNQNTKPSEAIAVEKLLSEFDDKRVPYDYFKKSLALSIPSAEIIPTTGLQSYANTGVNSLGYEIAAISWGTLTNGVTPKTNLYKDSSLGVTKLGESHFKKTPHSFWARSFAYEDALRVLEWQTDLKYLKDPLWNPRTPVLEEAYVMLEGTIYREDGVMEKGHINTLEEQEALMKKEKGTLQTMLTEKKEVLKNKGINVTPDDLDRVDRLNKNLKAFDEALKLIKSEKKRVLDANPEKGTIIANSKGLPLKFLNESLLDAARQGKKYLDVPTEETIFTIEGWDKPNIAENKTQVLNQYDILREYDKSLMKFGRGSFTETEDVVSEIKSSLSDKGLVERANEEIEAYDKFINYIENDKSISAGMFSDLNLETELSNSVYEKMAQINMMKNTTKANTIANTIVTPTVPVDFDAISESVITLRKEFITQIKNLKLDAEIKAKDNITKFNESQWKIDEMASKPFDISLISDPKERASRLSTTRDYRNFPKLWNKEFDTKLIKFTDEFGNTYNRAKVPDNFFQNDISRPPTEIKTYKKGGALPTNPNVMKVGGDVENNTMYKNFITGAYKGSRMKKKSEAIFDKLNRIHYKDAKAAGMSAPNYVMSHIVN